MEIRNNRNNRNNRNMEKHDLKTAGCSQKTRLKTFVLQNLLTKKLRLTYKGIEPRTIRMPSKSEFLNNFNRILTKFSHLLTEKFTFPAVKSKRSRVRIPTLNAQLFFSGQNTELMQNDL